MVHGPICACKQDPILEVAQQPIHTAKTPLFYTHHLALILWNVKISMGLELLFYAQMVDGPKV